MIKKQHKSHFNIQIKEQTNKLEMLDLNYKIIVFYTSKLVRYPKLKTKILQFNFYRSSKIKRNIEFTRNLNMLCM